MIRSNQLSVPVRINAKLRFFASSLAASAIGFLLSLFGAGSEVLIHYNNVFILFVGLCFGLFLLVGIFDVYIQLKDEHKNLTSTEANIEAVKSIPKSVASIVTFVERHEKITIRDNGDGEFDCTYLVSYNPDGHFSTRGDHVVENLHFPVLFDLPDESSFGGKNVDITLIQINGDTIPLEDAYLPQERRQKITKNGIDTKSAVQEYGVIVIPVFLTPQKNQVKIRTVTIYKGIFISRHTDDYVIVDIPYVTKHLHVTVLTDNPAWAIMPPANSIPLISAVGEMMELRDQSESSLQIRETIRHDNSISWITKSAKIGYRYNINFRMVKNG